MKRIWLVDDDLVILAGLQAVLQPMQVQCAAFSDPFQFLKWVSKGHAPDLLLMEYCLPGLRAVDVVKTLRGLRHFRYVPIIIVTTNNDLTSIQTDLLHAGATAVIYKASPFSKVAESIESAIIHSSLAAMR